MGAPGTFASQIAAVAGNGKRGTANAKVDPNNIGGLSVPKQTTLFVERLRFEAEQRGSKMFEFQEMIKLGKDMNLQVGDFKLFLEKLNM